MEYTEGQKKAIKTAVDRYYEGEVYTVISGGSGTGKAQPNSTLIPTPHGEVPLGELKVGDYVFDRCGNPTKILGVYPQGKLDCYKVTLSDDRSTICNDQHLWSYWNDLKLDTVTLREIIDNIDKHVYKIPLLRGGTQIAAENRDGGYTKAMEFSENPRKIPDEYIFTSIRNRTSFMSGILADADYDGTFYRIKSKNEEFLHSLQKMAWSLGIWCLIVNETTIFIDFHKDEGFEFDGVYIAKVEKLDYQEEMTCIYVDNEEHLYLTNDYIVTHNTTIVKPIIEELGFKEKEVAYAAYTGKAAQVLKSKGNKNIMTLHKLLYNNVPMKYGGYMHIPKTKLRYKVIIVDETSMLTDGIIDRLLYHDGIYFIFLGDANQLPPVMGKTNKLMENPHVHLDEVVRQGEESDIINLSVDILENVKLEQESYKNGDVLLFEREELTTGILDWADIVICGKNVTKNYFNNEIRAMKGLPQHLTEGDKVICRKNAYEFCSEQNQDFLVNGTLGTVHNIREDVFKVPTWTLDKDLRGKDMPIYICDLELDNGDVFKNIRIDRTALESENGLGLTQQVYTDIVRNSKRYRPPANLPFPFAYGYAITCHNAQGSQWDKVLVVEENYPFNPKEHKQWLYTATTRAAKKLVLIREPR